MRNPFRTLFLTLALAVCAPAIPSTGHAQGGIGDIVYTVGTVSTDAHGREWAYILWQATQPAVISNRVFAVYAKQGDATNALPYRRMSVVMLQTDARVIEPLLRRGENLGDTVDNVEKDLRQVFGNLLPAVNVDRATQLSAVIRGSLTDARNYQNLLLLARNHPAINMALGFADAHLIAAGRTTFEVRVFDAIANQDLAVIGRVTVESGKPTILPPPGPPVVVPDPSPKGDLNVRLRWGTPDALRRLGLMQFGCNLYRVSKAFATSQGWDAVNLPTPAELTNLLNQPNLVKRVNRVPITPSKMFTLAEAGDLLSAGADTNTIFIMDDDGRGRPGYVNYGFTNGAEFYYYAAARDILGRDGYLSQGLQVTLCDRMAPLPPANVSVENFYGYNTATRTSNQFLRVMWKQRPQQEPVTNYWIYRWSSIAEMNQLSPNFSNNLIAKVKHTPGAAFNSYVDSGPSSPKPSTDLGKTYWYTVRAGDAGACGQNLSTPAGPAYGVLRDRQGPPAGNGFIEINCLRPLVRYLDTKLITRTNDDKTLLDIRLLCERRDDRYEWAEFYAISEYNTVNGPALYTNFLGRHYFMSDNTVGVTWTPAMIFNGQNTFIAGTIQCRAALKNGKVSNLASKTISDLNTRSTFINLFEAFTQAERVIVGRNDRECREHQPDDDDGGIGVGVTPTPGSKEYRIFRRVDNGPMTMLCQGMITNLAEIITCIEQAMPANGGNVCFYFQLLDENGNPSPMVDLGCVTTAPNSPLPVPVLTKITPTGNADNPGMNISWFCPPYGVERFEVRVAAIVGAPLTNNYQLSARLVFNGGSIPMTVSNYGTNITLPFYSYLTPKVGSGFGNNAQFLVDALPEPGKEYVVLVRALGKNNNAGEFSNAESFLWGIVNPAYPNVPWPARELPSTNNNFFTSQAPAAFLSPTNPAPVFKSPADTMGNAVLIGSSPSPREVSTGKRPIVIYGSYDPHDGLFTNNIAEKILPCALYRYQVPNAKYPTVSGDVIQVSPLIERIAYELNETSPGTFRTYLHDPFITATFPMDAQQNRFMWLWIRDTQPQISGARYRYAIVRFKSNREIDQIIPTNEVEVP